MRGFKKFYLPTDSSEDPNFFLYVFVPKRKLTEEESNTLDSFKETDSDYYEGVKNGWQSFVQRPEPFGCG